MSKKRIILIFIIIMLFIIAILISSSYYKNKYIITFETGTQDGILNQYIDRNDKIKKPLNPYKEGYVFVEWQYEGKKFNFDTEIKKDIILTAKWIREEYVNIKFDTTTKEKIEDRKLLKGSNITDLPKIEKENFKFIGWFIDDKKYNEEQINYDITLTAMFEEIKHQYKVGDMIKITGCYSKTSLYGNCNNIKAIGWNRRILNILEGAEYPYVVGNSSGVTGFFKENSIKYRG